MDLMAVKIGILVVESVIGFMREMERSAISVDTATF